MTHFTAELHRIFRYAQKGNYMSRSKIPTCMLHTPPRPKFSSILLHDEQLLTYGPIFGKVHWMKPNDLDMFKVKNTNMHATYTPDTQIFIHFILRWAVLSYGSIFGKVRWMTPNDLDMLNVKNTNMHAVYTTRGPNFRKWVNWFI